jgi:hypothetical protein
MKRAYEKAAESGVLSSIIFKVLKDLDAFGL